MFKHRSSQKELLDATNIAQTLLWQNLKELAFINRYLGGHQISINALNQLFPKIKLHKLIYVADIGCGGGDSIKALQQWFVYKHLPVQLIGVDLKADCITYASNYCKALKEVQFICDDFRNVFSQFQKIDIVHASLFCHHFTEEEIISFIKICKANKAIFIINDLERNPVAYYAIKMLTNIFSKSPLVKHDAPLSVKRGFKKKEWRAMLEKAQVKHFALKNKWAFRHQLIIYPD
jgi:2-polyprenyl-3-methyl-5-hydroxy-6-metoxy-1,4-benzoquinol methylase